MCINIARALNVGHSPFGSGCFQTCSGETMGSSKASEDESYTKLASLWLSFQPSFDAEGQNGFVNAFELERIKFHNFSIV